MKRTLLLVAVTVVGAAGARADDLKLFLFKLVSPAIQMDGSASEWGDLPHQVSKFGYGEEFSNVNVARIGPTDADPVLVANDRDYLYLFIRFNPSLEGRDPWLRQFWIGVDTDNDSETGFAPDESEFGDENVGCERYLLLTVFQRDPGVGLPTWHKAESSLKIHRTSRENLREERLLRYDLKQASLTRRDRDGGVRHVAEYAVYPAGAGSARLWPIDVGRSNLIACGPDGVELAVPLDQLGVVADGSTIRLVTRDEVSVRYHEVRGGEVVTLSDAQPFTYVLRDADLTAAAEQGDKPTSVDNAR